MTTTLMITAVSDLIPATPERSEQQDARQRLLAALVIAR
jgi:hypothetical protein